MEETTAEFSAHDLAAETPLKVRVRVSVGAKTDLGRVREHNEDKFEFFIPEDDAVLASRGSVFLVCDGMGGHAAGQIASELAAKTFIDVYLHHPSTDPHTAIRSAVSAAHRFVTDVGRSLPARRGMGCTLTGLILRQGTATIVNVGDSRAYRLRDGKIVQLTQDHTHVDELLRAGILTPEQAETHPDRHILSRAIGGDGEAVPDLEDLPIRTGDVFLLCSDGLTNHVSDAQLEECLAVHGPSEAAWKLVGQALLGGGSDNVTVLIVRVDEVAEID
jgi:protein phosphatase